jgi:hypothetical protein
MNTFKCTGYDKNGCVAQTDCCICGGGSTAPTPAPTPPPTPAPTPVRATCGDTDGAGAGTEAVTCPSGYARNAGTSSTNCAGAACVTTAANSADTATCCEASPWTVISGQCTVDGYCIRSPNYPGNYGSSQSCEFSTSAEVAMSVEAFNTERNYDKVSVNGIPYSGTNGPQGITPTGALSWTSDHGLQKSGWKICQASTPAAGGTCSDPDPNTGGASDYVCPVGYAAKSNVATQACTSVVSCNANCCQATTYYALDTPNSCGSDGKVSLDSVGACQTAVDYVNALAGKTGHGSVSEVDYSFRPHGCYTACYSDATGYFCGYYNTNAGKDSYTHSNTHLICEAPASCTDIRDAWMVNNSESCTTWTWMYVNRCNAVSTINPQRERWITNKYCQQSCWSNGNGYDGDDCR